MRRKRPSTPFVLHPFATAPSLIALVLGAACGGDTGDGSKLSASEGGGTGDPANGDGLPAEDGESGADSTAPPPGDSGGSEEGAGGSGDGEDATCFDGTLNGDEVDVDCGGRCVPCTDFVPAFPGAIGPAAESPGGRGGTLYIVDTLADSGPGSLRGCAEATEPRVCAFEVSGEIALTSPIEVRDPFITIAGHTAPSPGVTIRDAPFQVKSHDVVIQHLRFRLGVAAGPEVDTFAVLANNGTDAYNIITDHCSMSWGTDGSWDAWKNAGAIYNVTVTNTIVAETLEPHALNFLFNESPDALPSSMDGMVIAHNFMAHGSQRNPRVTGAGEFLVFNNVIYNWVYSGSQIDDGKTMSGGMKASFIGNHYVSGPDRANFDRPPIGWAASVEPAELFVADNVVDGEFVADQSNAVNMEGPLPLADSTPIDLTPYAVIPWAEVLPEVVAGVGARPKDRDAVDERLVQDVMNGTGRYIADEAEVGGFPPLATNTRTLTPPDDPSGDDDGDGYTNLEEWLHTFYAEVQ